MKQSIYLLAIAALALGSCSADEPYKHTEVDPDAPILLYGGIRSGVEVTRGDGPIDALKQLNISLFRDDESYSATYTTGPVAATLEANGTIETGLFYLSDVTAKSKLIGVYPATIAANYSAGKVTYSSIDGSTDIMASNQVEGSKNSAMPSMQFAHLLTRIKVNIQTTADGAGKWGAVTAISVVDKKQDVVVTLPAPNGSGTATATGSGATAALPLTLEDGQQTPTTTNTLFGQAMFAPVTANAVLSFSVVTADGTFSVSTTTPQKYDAGKSYNVNLTFGATAITITSVTITAWDTDTTDQNVNV